MPYNVPVSPNGHADEQPYALAFSEVGGDLVCFIASK
jgi:hypothetical protein